MEIENTADDQSVDQSAVAPEAQEGAEAQPQPEQDTGAEAVEGEEQPGDDGTDSVEVEPIAAPASWAKDAKDMFATLPRETQEVIARREEERERFVRAKSQEVVSTKHKIESEARTALQTIMQNHQTALQQFLPEVPQMPDPRLLNTGNPEHRDLYFNQKAQYDYAVAQRDHIAQQIEQVQQHAGAIAQQQMEADLQAEHQLLHDKLGDEWSDPSSRAKLFADLEPIAAELGYSQEVMAQARAADILALRKIGDWRSDAEKYRSLMKKKMEPVRAAKSLPPAGRPGVTAAAQAPTDPVALLYPDDIRR